VKDINYPLQKAYYSALTGITIDSVLVPCYYKKLPNNIAPDNYIIFSPINNNDGSTKSSYDTDTFMQVSIYTFAQNGNTGEACGLIAEEIFTRLYTTPFTVAGFTMNGTRLDSDTTTDYTTEGIRTYVERRLVFKHLIAHA
jgi:hypothetical protein